MGAWPVVACFWAMAPSWMDLRLRTELPATAAAYLANPPIPSSPTVCSVATPLLQVASATAVAHGVGPCPIACSAGIQRIATEEGRLRAHCQTASLMGIPLTAAEGLRSAR